MNRLLLISALFALSACGSSQVASTGPSKVDIPVTDGMPKPKKKAPRRESPPPSGTTKEAPFPTAFRSKLGNGMSLDVVTAKTVPVVHATMLIRAGSGYGAAPGVADLTAELLKDGGTRAMASADVLQRVETLGSDLSIDTDADATRISLALTKDKLAEGLAILEQIVREPRFDDGELKKLKSRLIDETADALRSSGEYMADHAIGSELYAPSQPYAREDALPSELAKVDRAQIEAHYRRFFVPSNAALILVGDVDQETATQLANKNFGNWAGGQPPKIDFGDLEPPPDKTRVIVVNRPKSAQSDIFVVLRAPPRRSKDWAKVRVAEQILGGGVGGRLFQDVREERSLAYHVSASIKDRAHGDQPLVLYAGTQTPKTADAVTGLLENATRMKSSPPTDKETASARRYLDDIFAIYMERLEAIGALIGIQETFGLAPSYFDDYRKDLRATTEADAAEESAKLFGDAAEHAVIVVAGDADAIGPGLAHFGDVTVVDPEHEFKTIKTIPTAK